MSEHRVGDWDFLSGELDRDRRNLGLVMDTVGDLYGPFGVEERMRRAVDRAVQVTGAERCILLTGDEGDPTPRVARDAQHRDLPLDERYSQSVVAQVWKTQQPLRRIGAADEREDFLGQSVIDLRLLSIMAVPLRYEGRRLGVLYVDATYRTKDFTESEYLVFLALGGLVATALENARLAEESAERDRMERQIELARDVQRRLVPRNIVAPKGLSVAGEGRVCQDLSGDYFDVIPRPDGALALVVGDVSGHGIRTALYMATTRALIRSLMREGFGADDSLARLNDFLEEDMSASDFMSLFLAVLTTEGRSLTFASAGHNPPLLRRAAGGIVELERTGPILGTVPGAAYKAGGPIALAPGDVLVLYTDGIFEARNSEGAMYGEDRLRDSLDRHAGAGLPADGVLHGLLEDLDRFRGPGSLEDDITCLVVRVHDPAQG